MVVANQLTTLEHSDPLRDLEDRAVDLRDQQPTHPRMLIELHDELEQPSPIRHLEAFEESIDDHDLGVSGERARQARQLPPPGADLPREALGVLVEPAIREESLDRCGQISPPLPVISERKGDVLPDRAVGVQGSALEDDPHSSPHSLILAIAHRVDVSTLELDGPLRRPLEPCGDLEERRQPARGVYADDRRDFTRAEVEVNPAEDIFVVAVASGDTLQLQDRLAAHRNTEIKVLSTNTSAMLRTTARVVA